MTRQAATRARILKVRTVQHRLAATRVVAATEKLERVLGNMARLEELRHALVPVVGGASGASLAQAGEMATRLSAHDDDLARAAQQSRAALVRCDADRQQAHIMQEGSERLYDRARRDAAQHRAMRLSQLPRSARVRAGQDT